MAQLSRIDAFGAVSLTGFALLLAFNQVVIKVGNDGLQPIFFAALRSLGGALLIFGWMRLRGLSVGIASGTVLPGILIGSLFAVEFVCLFLALDLTTVTRTSVIFYTMPMWLTLAAHFLIPGDRLTARKSVGLALAFVGVTIALTQRPGGGEASILGDFLALVAAMAWAGIALVARATALKEVRPEMQLLWQLAVSAVLLMLVSPLFGPFLRAPEFIHWAALGFQIVAVVSAGFLFWFWLLTLYPTSSVAAFAFLSPVFGVALGWSLLGEEIGVGILLSLALVCTGLILVNRPARRA